MLLGLKSNTSGLSVPTAEELLYTCVTPSCSTPCVTLVFPEVSRNSGTRASAVLLLGQFPLGNWELSISFFLMQRPKLYISAADILLSILI